VLTTKQRQLHSEFRLFLTDENVCTWQSRLNCFVKLQMDFKITIFVKNKKLRWFCSIQLISSKNCWLLATKKMMLQIWQDCISIIFVLPMAVFLKLNNFSFLYSVCSKIPRILLFGSALYININIFTSFQDTNLV
jgi:hypothetical protein